MLTFFILVTADDIFKLLSAVCFAVKQIKSLINEQK